MKLFHEVENKYYEFLSYLLNHKAEYSKEEIYELFEKEFSGEVDFEVMDSLFSKENGSIFCFDEGNFVSAIQESLPIRNTKVELQAAKLLTKTGYERHFLSEETIYKLDLATKDIESEWNLDAIVIKNQYAEGATVQDKNYEKELRLLRKAIKEKTAICCDNEKEGEFSYHDRYIVPVKLEYSFIGDRYWVCVYEPVQKRYFKMRLDTMSNIRMTEKICREAFDGYAEYQKKHSKKVILEVERTRHVIERCFRIFSYYDRQAVYDEKEKKYLLEIQYFSQDEKELIRDIMSLGSSVVVLEPQEIQQEVYRRILLAKSNYNAE